MDCSTDRKWTNSFFPSASIDAIRGESEFSRFIMDIIKLRLQNRPWGAVDKTPVFDSATGGFVYVYGGTDLKKRRSAILAVSEMTPFGLGVTGVGSTTKNVRPSIFKAGR